MECAHVTWSQHTHTHSRSRSLARACSLPLSPSCSLPSLPLSLSLSLPRSLSPSLPLLPHLLQSGLGDVRLIAEHAVTVVRAHNRRLKLLLDPPHLVVAPYVMSVPDTA
eukprot:509890-Rhodomonas_salina.1